MRRPSSLSAYTVCAFTPTVSWVTCTGPWQTDSKTRWVALTAEPRLPPPRGHLTWSKGHPWEWGGMKNGPSLGGKEGQWKPTGPGFCIASMGIQGSLPTTPSRQLSPQIQKISNNWFGFWPVPFWCKSNSTVH